MPDYHQDLNDFYVWFDNQRSATKGLAGDSAQPIKAFVPRGATINYITRNARRLLAALYPDHPRQIPSVDDVVRNCPLGLAILLKIRRGSYIAYFVQNEHLHDEHLPFLVTPYAFSPDGGDDFFEEFYRAQWEFCAHVFRLSHGGHLVIPPEVILPITEVAEIEQRSTSKIYKISIHAEHDKLQGDQASLAARSLAGHLYVMKTYRGRDARILYETEVAAFKHIIDAKAQDHFIRFYGGFKHGDTYSIILEHADIGTLDNFFYQAAPPRTTEEILEFWRNIFQVLEGLYGLHGIPANHRLEFPAARGWHQDIKPSNILALSQRARRDCDIKFKICDLGLSHFRLARTGSNMEQDRDVGGTREYGAPECCRPDDVPPNLDRAVGQSVDIWSFACVCLEAACWVVGGWADLVSFRNRRRLETKQISHRHSDIGCFHDGTDILPCVSQMLDHLQQAAQHSRYNLTDAIIDQIRLMLVPDRDRPSSHQLTFTMRELLQRNPSTPQQPRRRRSTQTRPGRDSSGSSVGQRIANIQAYGYAMDDTPATKLKRDIINIASLRHQYGLRGDALDWYHRVKDSRRHHSPPPTPYNHYMKEMGKRDVIFLVDDVQSMRPYWSDVIDTVRLLAYLLKPNDDNGMDLYFSTLPGERAAHSRNSTDLANAVSSRGLDLQGSSDISLSLTEILRESHQKMNRFPQNSTGNTLFPALFTKPPKPLSVYVLTDGIWREHIDPFSPIDLLVQTMRRNSYARRHVGIQFISFGNDPGGLAKLRSLDDNEAWSDKDVVDTEPYDGNVMKMAFGGHDKTLDYTVQSPPLPPLDDDG